MAAWWRADVAEEEGGGDVGGGGVVEGGGGGVVEPGGAEWGILASGRHFCGNLAAARLKNSPLAPKILRAWIRFGDRLLFPTDRASASEELPTDPLTLNVR